MPGEKQPTPNSSAMVPVSCWLNNRCFGQPVSFNFVCTSLVWALSERLDERNPYSACGYVNCNVADMFNQPIHPPTSGCASHNCGGPNSLQHHQTTQPVYCNYHWSVGDSSSTSFVCLVGWLVGWLGGFGGRGDFFFFFFFAYQQQLPLNEIKLKLNSPFLKQTWHFFLAVDERPTGNQQGKGFVSIHLFSLLISGTTTQMGVRWLT